MAKDSSKNLWSKLGVDSQHNERKKVTLGDTADPSTSTGTTQRRIASSPKITGNPLHHNQRIRNGIVY